MRVRYVHLLKYVIHLLTPLNLGGTDTTVTALHTFFLAMVRNPEVQEKAQLELDTTLGCERLPDYEDIEALPYINAVV